MRQKGKKKLVILVNLCNNTVGQPATVQYRMHDTSMCSVETMLLGKIA